MQLHSVREGWRIALDQLRANKLRSALTVLGVVIGIATVMAMASIVAGFREQIVNTLEVVGPTTFRVLRYFSTTGVNPDAVPREVRIRPKLVPQEAEAIARLPEIHYAAIWTQLFERFEYGGNHTRILGVFGADDRFMEILGGGISSGRSEEHTSELQSHSDLVCRLLLEKKKKKKKTKKIKRQNEVILEPLKRIDSYRA